MLQSNRIKVNETSTDAIELVSPAAIYAAVREFVSRQYPIIILTLCVSVVLGAVYVFTTPARYTARAEIVIDTHTPQMLQAQAALGDLAIDSPTTDTQIEILKSEDIAESIIKKHHLTEDPEFTSPKVSLFRQIFNFFLSLIPEPATSAKERSHDDRIIRHVIDNFEDNLTVKRIGLTYAIEIEFRSLNSDRAAQLANAVADGYVVNTLEAKYLTTRRAADWLQDRLKELREQSSTAERVVNEFKAKNNIVDSGGRLLNEQQLAELNSSLIQARAQTTEAKARFDRVTQVLHSDDIDSVTGVAGTVTDSLKNDVITKLRQQYLDYAAKEADWSHRYGEDHLAAVNLRNQMREIRRSIIDELGSIAETYKSDYEIAKAQEDSIQKSLNDIVAQSQSVNGAEVTLHDLDSTAQTSRALYDNFLQRYMESVQQQSFPISDARMITRATRPIYKSSPKTLLIFGLSVVVGLISGIGAGYFREISDRMFRSTAQVRERLDADCIGVVPFVKNPGNHGSLSLLSRYGAPQERGIVKAADLLSIVSESPFSQFSESIRSLKISIDLSRASKANKVIAVTSSLPNEGKSTIAGALAQMAACSGSRVLLIDGDLRNNSLSRKLAPGATQGLLELISGEAQLENVIWRDCLTGLSFLPTVAVARLPHSGEILASEAMRSAVEILRTTYDYIIVDLPALASVLDARAISPLIDSYVFVVEWGRTKIDVAETALYGARDVFASLLGVVVNKAHASKFRRYEPSRAA